jgi:hypothetical protein
MQRNRADFGKDAVRRRSWGLAGCAGSTPDTQPLPVVERNEFRSTPCKGAGWQPGPFATLSEKAGFAQRGTRFAETRSFRRGPHIAEKVVPPRPLLTSGNRHEAPAALAGLAREHTAATHGRLGELLGVSRRDSVPNRTRRFGRWLVVRPEVRGAPGRVGGAVVFPSGPATRKNQKPGLTPSSCKVLHDPKLLRASRVSCSGLLTDSPWRR